MKSVKNGELNKACILPFPKMLSSHDNKEIVFVDDCGDGITIWAENPKAVGEPVYSIEFEDYHDVPEGLSITLIQ
jgi:hypothetical protein